MSRSGWLVGALVCGALCACSSQESSTLAGDVVAGRPSTEIIGDFGFVLIPSGRVDVVVGEARDDDVTAEEAGDGQAHEAPEDGSWIPVNVAYDAFGEMAVPVRLMGGSPQPAQVALVVDGTTVNLGAPYRVVGGTATTDSGLDNVWVSVDEQPDEVSSVQVAVTYDGLTQTLDPQTGARESGAAQVLYDRDAGQVEAACDPRGFDQGSVRLRASCAIGPGQRTPYLPGAGWATDSRSWLVVDAAVSLDRALVGRTSYDVASIEPRMTVDGHDPLPSDGRDEEIRHDPGRVSATWAFDAPAGGAVEVALALDLVLEKDDPKDPGPSTRRVTTQQVVEIG